MTTAVSIAPSPIQQFFNNLGQPNAGGSVLTQVGGINAATYQDSAGTTALPNPIPLNSRGEVSNAQGISCQLFLVDSSTYTFTLFDVNGNQLNQSTWVSGFGQAFNAFLATLGLGTGSQQIGYTVPLTGGVLRTQFSKDFDVVSVKDFGAKGNGLVDDTNAIQLALNSGAAAVYIPFGTYIVSGGLVASTAVAIFGDGFGTVLQTGSAVNDVISVTAPNVWIRQLRITGTTTQTAGWRIQFSSSCSRVKVSDVWIDGYLMGIQSSAAATLDLNTVSILNGIATTAVGVRIDAGADITMTRMLMDQAAQIFAGILVTNCADIKLSNSNIIHCGQALFLNPTAGLSTPSVWASNTHFDTSTRGLYAFANGGTILRCIFEQCWFSDAIDQGVLVQSAAGGSVDGMYFNGCQGLLNGADGINVNDSGCINVHVRGGSYAQNTGSGVSFNAGVSNFSVIGARIGAGDGLLGNADGIFVGTGAGSNYTLCDNILRSNNGNPLVDGGTGTGKVLFNNPDYDSGRAAWTPGAITTGSFATTTVAVFGAAIGDQVTVQYSGGSIGRLQLSGDVNPAGTVNVYMQNPTGGTITPTPGEVVVNTSRRT